jgi:tetratricopeptide (TPR) repeat protein
MAALKPSAGAYARISYARELLGDLPGAVEAMELAVDAAIGAAEPYAWTNVQLGKLRFQTGSLDEAEASHRRALDAFPGYVYALEALAEVEAARGDLPAAIELASQAAEAVPLPQFVALLADLHDAIGQPAEAAEQRALMDAIQRLLAANGVRTDLETALYYADQGIRLDEALVLARRGQAERPSVLGDDTLAWVLERNGRCEEARTASDRALRLGTKDALAWFHRGMIERCLGDEQAARTWFARAIELNPHFSVRWAPQARAALGEEPAA